MIKIKEEKNIDTFCNEMLVGGYSVDTVKSYRSVMNIFSEYVKIKGRRGERIDNTTENTINSFLLHYDINTRIHHSAILRKYYKHIKREIKIGNIKKKERILDFKRYEDVMKLNIQKGNQQIIKFLLKTGIRVTELLSIRYFSKDLRSFRIIGKGNRERIAYVTNLDSDEELMEFIKYSNGYFIEKETNVAGMSIFERVADGDYYDENNNLIGISNKTEGYRTGWSLWHRNKVNRIMSTVAKRNGIKFGRKHQFWVHGLRHAWFTHMIEKGKNPRLVQEAGGQKSAVSIEPYLKLSDNSVRNEMLT